MSIGVMRGKSRSKGGGFALLSEGKECKKTIKVICGLLGFRLR